jgi:hypothetical protein
MIKSQDILILVDSYYSHSMTLEQQKERAEDFYARTSKSVLVKTVIVSRKTYATKTKAIKDMLSIGPFRVVVCHKNLLSYSKQLLQLFDKAKSIGAIDGEIRRSWIKERLKYHNKEYGRQKTVYKKSEPKAPAFDSFGLPIVNGGEWGTINSALAKKALKKEKQRKKESIRRTLHLEAQKTLLAKRKLKYQSGAYKEMYDILTWYAPAKDLLTRQHIWERAVAFLKKTKAYYAKSASLSHVLPSIMIYNTKDIPEKILPVFKSIITKDRKFVYESKPKRSHRKV